jgi:hypothetical protein
MGHAQSSTADRSRSPDHPLTSRPVLSRARSREMRPQLRAVARRSGVSTSVRRSYLPAPRTAEIIQTFHQRPYLRSRGPTASNPSSDRQAPCEPDRCHSKRGPPASCRPGIALARYSVSHRVRRGEKESSDRGALIAQRSRPRGATACRWRRPCPASTAGGRLLLSRRAAVWCQCCCSSRSSKRSSRPPTTLGCQRAPRL